jgi:Fic-DOC domain mobile mystery protein B
MNIDYPEGATPLHLGQAAGLIPTHIVNHGQLNEWELTNVLKGERWAFGASRRRIFRTTNEMLTPEFVRALHKRMFGDTWRWAGVYRQTEKNIGVDPLRIAIGLTDLCEDVKAQLEFASYPLDEIAERFSHRLVSIHPFANGNGRLSRTAADLLLVERGARRFTWGATNLVRENDTRLAYLSALRAADAKDYKPLLAFVRT